MKKITGLVTAIMLGALSLAAQAQKTEIEAEQNTAAMHHVPIYRVTVVARTIAAINYLHRKETLVDFHGTALQPDAVGGADVFSGDGATRIAADFKKLPPASTFGPEYTTYVLWAISPEGRPVNLGEVLPNDDGKAKLKVTSDLQSFGMIVTAEPYFAVSQPSDVVVLENFVTPYTNGTLESVDAKYELLKRGQYSVNVNPRELTRIVAVGTPLEIVEARNAVRIARWAGAEHYAPDSFSKAVTDLKNAEGLMASKKYYNDMIMNAREAAQMAEDARMITVRKMEATEQAQARQTAAQQSAIAASANQRAETAEQAKAEAEAAKTAAEQEAEQAQQTAEQARSAAAAAQQQANQAEVEKAALRSQLQQQLNVIITTRDTARGLIMSMPDVLFETGKYTLKPTAREKLAKISGILIAHPGLTVEIDGYTDNVGGDQFNQTLSEERAVSVRDYLASQGVPSTALAAKGFGKTNPAAPNDTAQGRQQNRRVELIVSGEPIKAQLSSMNTMR